MSPTCVNEEKKKLERQLVEEARGLCSLFPAGELTCHEQPDFLLHAAGEVIGIEVTRIGLQEKIQQAERLTRVPPAAKKRFDALVNAPPLDVSVAFGPDASDMRTEQLTKSLVEFVWERRKSRGSHFDVSELPDGYASIDIDDPLPDIDPQGKWRSGSPCSREIASQELLDQVIAGKNRKLPAYRKSTPTVWLLIVSDEFHGPGRGAGEVYVDPDDLAEWRFEFNFDRIMLFSRGLGGAGQVSQLQRAPISPACTA